MPAQHFQYKRIRKRMKRTFYYGRNDRMDQLSVPLSEFSREYFDKNCPFDYLDMDFATNISKEGCVSPCSLIVAMIYMDRFRNLSQDQFEAADPADLYMSALLVASKYLNDDGESDYVYNDEWAASAQKPLKHVNQQELKLLTGIEWKLMVESADFFHKLRSMEISVAGREVKKRGSVGFLSYTELDLLSDQLGNPEFLWTTFLQPFFAVFGLASLIYSAAVLALYAATISVSCVPSLSTNRGLSTGQLGPQTQVLSPMVQTSQSDSCMDNIPDEIWMDFDLQTRILTEKQLISNRGYGSDYRLETADEECAIDDTSLGWGLGELGRFNDSTRMFCDEVNLTEFSGLDFREPWILSAVGDHL